MERKHLVTIKDIAHALNISVATVSRAFRDTYDVSPLTRQKVLQKAAELKYKPNFNARGLVNFKSHNIFVILPTITNYYYSTVVKGIQEIAYENDYNIVLHLTDEKLDRELTIIDSLPLSSVDGLLACITSGHNHKGYLNKIINNGIPVVFFDRAVESIQTSKVLQNDFDGAFRAVEHLIENGYTRIAHISGPKELTLSKKRFDGYLEALKKHHLPYHKEWVINSEFNQESGANDVAKLFRRKLPIKPHAIFAVNDRKAIGAMLELKKRKIVVGKEFGVVGFTNDPISTIISPTLTTIEEPALEIGRQSCKLLLKQIKKQNPIVEEIILNGTLMIRESSKKE